jgi:hypothetical protein
MPQAMRKVAACHPLNWSARWSPICDDNRVCRCRCAIGFASGYPADALFVLLLLLLPGT